MKREYVPLFSAVCTSEKLADLKSDSHRLFYTWLLTQCDPWGRIESSPRILCAKVWPVLGRTAKDTGAALGDCCRVGLLEVHGRDGSSWVQVPDWEGKAGKLRRTERCGRSKWPDPQEDSGSTPGVIQEYSGKVPGRGEERREEKRRGEEKGETPSPPIASGPAWVEPLEQNHEMDTPASRDALAEWVAYRRERRLAPWQRRTWEKNLAGMRPRGATGLIAAVQHSIAQGYQGLFPPKSNGSQQAFESPAHAAVRKALESRHATP